ncbi:MAG TPA: cytochrome c3 family protein [Candidatus Eisenbacteria bacterium]|nr:cytochrome c3 family protein [Candidatus Eisenbacteria bacterium]
MTTEPPAEPPTPPAPTPGKKPSPFAAWIAWLTSAPLRSLGFLGALLFGIGLVLTFSAVEVTSKPTFCGSCHIMAPYYKSWKTSSHGKIACVECHIPPGVTAEIRKKYEAISMVARYFTGTYGTKPWTEISDAACLRCHERRLLAGKELLGDVLFDHSAHLTEMRRGKTLRCTSCHGQMVQGSHIAVTTSTCILCHFKGAQEGEGTTRCVLCHQIPEKTYKLGAVSFQHSDVAKFGMECRWCHAQPQGSTGEVPRERCQTCHNQVERLAEYDNDELLHRKHVTEHKVDCMDCHLQLQHVAPIAGKGAAKAEAAVKSAAARIHQAASDCKACHEAGHSPQLALYTGTGGRGVAPMPSPMFEAGVRCEGCHTSMTAHGAAPSAANRASDVSCMACHGAEYRKIYLGWKSGTEQRAAAVGRQLQETERAIGSASPRLADARFNQSLVARGHGLHNVSYSYALLRRSHEDMNAARREKGLAPLPAPWREPPYKAVCFDCHDGIQDQRGEAFGRTFAHAKHVVDAKVECKACHRAHEEKPEGEVLRFGAEGCVSCHHKAPAANCAACHGDIKKKVVKSFRGDFDHAVHIDDAEKTCVDCHDLKAPMPGIKKAACLECHDA